MDCIAETLKVRNRREVFLRELLSAIEVFSFARETALLAGN
jgi:hypothetical protein